MLHTADGHVNVVGVRVEADRQGLEHELGVYLHGELSDGLASREHLSAERDLDVRIDERHRSIAVVRVHRREEA